MDQRDRPVDDEFTIPSELAEVVALIERETCAMEREEGLVREFAIRLARMLAREPFSKGLSEFGQRQTEA